jgi:signal transduction histidine kinase
MNPTKLAKSFSWRSFVLSCFFSIFLFAVIAFFYWQFRDVDKALNVMDFAAIFIFVFFYGLLQWMFQRNTLSKLVADPSDSMTVKAADTSAPKETGADRKTRKNNEKRLFVHLFAVLQRQGRLMDFLQEDLSSYADDQIGAAVRSIHENCRKTIHRYLSPEPVMNQSEGERVEIAPGFDQRAVKLVGNVVGQPPFTGILRHRGWQLHTIRLPELSDTENPNIIAPAEVEID